VPPNLDHRFDYRFLCIGFRHDNNVATCIYTLNEAESLQGGASPLWPRKYSVYASRLLFACTRRRIRKYRFASRARLDRGGWLALAPQGLSPCKKRQASLDALTPSLSGARLWRVRWRRLLADLLSAIGISVLSF